MRSKFKLFLVLIGVFATVHLFSQNQKIDSLKKVLLSQKDTSEINTLNALAKEFSPVSLDSCIKYNKVALDKNSRINFPRGQAKAMMRRAGIYRVKGEIDSATTVYNLIIKIATKHNLLAERGEAYMFIGFMLQNQSEFDQSILNLIKAEKDLEKANHLLLQARSSWMLGNAYLKIKAYRESEDYYNKGKECFAKLGDSLGYFDCVLNTAIIYDENERYDDAMKLILSSEAYYRKVNHTGALSASLINKAEVLSKIKKYKEAEVALLEALELKKALGAPLGIATCIKDLGDLYKQSGNYVKAEKFYFDAIELARKDNTQHIILAAYKALYEVYKAQSKHVLALDFHEKYVSLNDSIYNSDKSKIIEEMKAKFETEKKDKQILQKNSEIEKNQLEIEQKSFQRNAFLIGLFLVLILVVIAFVGYKQKKNANAVLHLQNTEITQQKQLIQLQKHKVEEHQKEIIDSINYAKKIQYALLAHDDLLNENLAEHFVLFKPKDIVSGDFYWATRHNNKFYLAVCDSTGHGVPGAFMSLLNIGFLSEAIKEKNISEPNEVLNFVRKRLMESIGNDGQQDGMDAILMCFDMNTKVITYSAANNEPILISNNQIVELPKDKMPVGKGEKSDSFTLYSTTVNAGDTLYLYTDGYADQFGGEKGKKFKYKKLNELLLTNSSLPSKVVSDILLTEFDAWKGDLEQVDDVCIIGIKF
ncbi:MAG: SpoIIE family protein phosphatase [Bacteroidota bacterium]